MAYLSARAASFQRSKIRLTIINRPSTVQWPGTRISGGYFAEFRGMVITLNRKKLIAQEDCGIFASSSRIFPAFENKTYDNKSPRHRSITWNQYIRGVLGWVQGNNNVIKSAKNRVDALAVLDSARQGLPHGGSNFICVVNIDPGFGSVATIPYPAWFQVVKTATYCKFELFQIRLNIVFDHL